MKHSPYCLLLTGMPNSGKTTIAYELAQKRLRNVLIIDGDKHREMQFLGEKLGFTEEDILKNNKHVIKLAQFAQEQGINVLISQVTPYRKQREEMSICLEGFIEVLCDCPKEVRASRPNFVESDLWYELGVDVLVLDTDKLSVEQCADRILEKLRVRQEVGSRG